ncbi:5'-nucleotidase C-terminal domain-containing protein [Streptococcus sp. DD12]|uniref:5'-nucleotidase C-terminal domain-containing protein n=1 Tax=Streptococcus sp. DD12 TaxID=1777880 RepID=UPI0008302EE1|nr:5'-nucleotidase C-terminal domain-containing protein [Streptococcus sp. DD12]
MKKQVLLATTLSAVLLSSAALAQTVQADDLDGTTSQTTTGSEAQDLAVTDTNSSASTDESAATTASTSSDTTAVSSDTASATSSSAANDTASQTDAASGGDSTDRAATAEASSTTSTASDTVTVLHTNDVHGRMLEDSNNGVIGDARLSGIVNASRAQGTTLVFDSGDSFQGLPISNSTEGEDMAKVMNAIGYDAMTVGNHEFDFGLDQLRQLSTQINFPIITSNVYVNGVRLFQPSTIVDKTPGNDGDEVVVIGVTTPETATKTHPRNLPGVTFTDPITEVKAVVDQMESNARAEGKDYKTYIILSHLGVDTTTPVEWRGSTLAEALSNYAPLKDKRVLVLDGHSHTLLTASYGDNVTYNQTGSYLNNVGRVVFNADRVLSQGAISAKEAQNYPINPAVQEMLDAFKAQYEADSSKVVIANSPVKLSGDRMDVRVRETNLGNVVADALLDYGQSGFTHKSNLAVTNGGGLRETIAKDKPVTKGDIIAVLPFGNSVAQIQVTGQNIYDMFAKSLGSILQVDSQGQTILDENGQPLMEPNGGFLQTAGARVYYDTSLPAANRILSIAIWDPETDQYKPLVLGQTYYLVTNDFLAAGGDGYTMLGGPREEGPSMDSVFADYLTRVNLLDYAAIHPNSRTIAISRAAYMALVSQANAATESSQETATYPLLASQARTLSAEEKTVQNSRPLYRSLPATGDQGTSTVLLGLGLLLSLFGLVGKKKTLDMEG